jgi:hypothetical protein
MNTNAQVTALRHTLIRLDLYIGNEPGQDLTFESGGLAKKQVKQLFAGSLPIYISSIKSYFQKSKIK